MKKLMLISLGLLQIVLLLSAFTFVVTTPTNVDRLVIGINNRGADPNPTKDITLQKGEVIDNSTDGTIDFGAANLSTTGTLSSGDVTFDSLQVRTINLSESITGTPTADLGATNASTLGLSGLFSPSEDGIKLRTHTIAAGDSTFLHSIVDAADTVLKCWNGTAWVTITDLAP